MAKSIRSKWKRKCRAIKRERYGKKELERLKTILGKNDNVVKDEDMVEISEIANVTDGKTIKRTQVDENEMETNATKRVFNSKTYRDQNGAYPVWLHPRKMLKKNSKKKSKKGKKGKR